MIKDTSKAMDWMDQLSVIIVNYKKTVTLITIQKTFFCQENCFNFQSNQDSFFVKHIVLIVSLIKTDFFRLAILNLRNEKHLNNDK